MMEVTKSINAERGWDGYRLPLHSESVLLSVNFFFGFHFILFFLICSLLTFHHLSIPLRPWPGPQELTR